MILCSSEFASRSNNSSIAPTLLSDVPLTFNKTLHRLGNRRMQELFLKFQKGIKHAFSAFDHTISEGDQLIKKISLSVFLIFILLGLLNVYHLKIREQNSIISKPYQARRISSLRSKSFTLHRKDS